MFDGQRIRLTGLNNGPMRRRNTPPESSLIAGVGSPHAGSALGVRLPPRPNRLYIVGRSVAPSTSRTL